jgi:hypothetical protein
MLYFITINSNEIIYNSIYTFLFYQFIEIIDWQFDICVIDYELILNKLLC